MGPIGWWRQVTHGLRVLLRRRGVDRELTEEMRHYLELAAAEHRARGLSAEAAERAARLEAGNMTVAREEIRSAGWESRVGSVLGDLSYAVRCLRRSPGFTVVSCITLALGIGASTAIFSVVNPILFESLPYPDPEQIATIADVGQERSPVDVTFGTYRELLVRSRDFTAMAAWKPWQPTLMSNADPERLAGQRVSASYFRLLGVHPLLGRSFEPADDRPDIPPVVVVSHGLWRRRFAADPGIVGRTIRLDDASVTVVGVMPGGFENVLAPAAEVWAPLQYATVFGPESREWGHHLKVVARLRPGLPLSLAERSLATIAAQPVPEFPRMPWASLEGGVILTPLQAAVTRAVAPALLALLGAVLLVLAIASVNVTNLMLARGARRRGEFAMRAALGAGRNRLARQLLTESLLLAFLGGAVGLIVAEAGIRGLGAAIPPSLPRVGAIRLNGAVFGFCLVVTTVIGVAIGLIPALHASRASLQFGLQQSSRRTAGGHLVTRGALVVAEIALALMLLVGAGLLVRSIARVFAMPVGFDPGGLLTLQIQESGVRYASDDARNRGFLAMLDAVRAAPGVTAAALTSQLPLSGDLDGYGARFERFANPSAEGGALRYAVSPGYFEAMRIPLRRGRLLDERDRVGAPRAALLNESFAKRIFAGGEALGERLRFGPDQGDWFTVVGVVGDVRQSPLEVDPPDAVYIAPAQWHWVDNLMSMVVRTSGDPAAIAPGVRAAIWSVDRNRPILRVATMTNLVDRSIADRHFASIMFEIFGLVALLLAVTGIFGVLSGAVHERMRELGVRSALGASRADIVGLVLRHGMGLALAGVAIGLLGAGFASRALVSMLFGVSRLDAPTYLTVIAILAFAALAACALPALRAARIDPARTLRIE
jgi:putative ABC transport system permease protein